MTLAELFALYLDGHAKLHKKSWQEDEKTFHRYMAKWESRRLSELTRNDVMTLHARIGKNNGKYAANRLLSLLSKMFSFAAEVGFDGTNPAKGIRKFREESRERFLNADELRRLFAALEVEPKLFRDFFKVALLTGARRGNVLTMRWKELDLDRGLWKVTGEQSKSGDPLTIHLTPAAIEILVARRELVEGEYVFPGRRETTPHLTDPSPAWRRVLKRAKLEDLRIHDLRRTLGSWQAAAGVSLSVIGKSLGHKNTSTTQIYARLSLDPVRVSVDAAAAAMLKAIGENDEQEGGEADAD